jgi:tetratricopeptide (TPR) repeat protein
MMIHWLECASSPPPRKNRPLPSAEAEFIRGYESLTDAQRAEMGANDLARATWIYYALGMEDLVLTNNLEALKKFDAASESPDTALAAEALYQSALIYRGMGELGKARECLEHLLFSTKVVESGIRATYELARCLSAAGDQDAAFRRMEELVTRYPASPYADLARRDPLYLQRKPPEPAPPGPEAKAGGAGR